MNNEKKLLEGYNEMEIDTNNVKYLIEIENQISHNVFSNSTKNYYNFVELHNLEIIKKAKETVEELAPRCSTLEDLKEEIERLYQELYTKENKNYEDKLKEASYSHLLLIIGEPK